MATNSSLHFKKFSGEGELSMDFFELKTTPLPEIKDGQVLLRNLYLSCDPTNRIFASGKESYVPAAKIGGKMPAIIVGEVVESKVPAYEKGICVVAWGSWETYSAVSESSVLLRIDPSTPIALETYMAVINTLIGLTAWVGVHRIMQVKAGDRVCVSGAAGAVGSLVCQLAKEAGATTVVGICGSADKCTFIKTIGCTGAINYKTENVKQKLAELCPEGYTCYFDNVGGDITEAVLESMAKNGRVALCGLISQYDHQDTECGRLRCWQTILFRRLSVKGFICLDYESEAREAFAYLEQLLKQNKLHFNKHVFVGDVTKCVEAVQAIIKGTNVGKAMVKIAEPSNPAYHCA